MEKDLTQYMTKAYKGKLLEKHNSTLVTAEFEEGEMIHFIIEQNEAKEFFISYVSEDWKRNGQASGNLKEKIECLGVSEKTYEEVHEQQKRLWNDRVW